MIRKAGKQDLNDIRQCAADAFHKYVDRIGRKPAPMVADFEASLSDGNLYVSTDEANQPTGYIVFYPRAGHVHLENVAVHPDHQGQGIGLGLIGFAERKSREAGYRRIELYTNARMTENLALYTALGYRQTDRRVEDGFERVFFSKRLG